MNTEQETKDKALQHHLQSLSDVLSVEEAEAFSQWFFSVPLEKTCSMRPTQALCSWADSLNPVKKKTAKKSYEINQMRLAL